MDPHPLGQHLGDGLVHRLARSSGVDAAAPDDIGGAVGAAVGFSASLSLLVEQSQHGLLLWQLMMQHMPVELTN